MFSGIITQKLYNHIGTHNFLGIFFLSFSYCRLFKRHVLKHGITTWGKYKELQSGSTYAGTVVLSDSLKIV